MFIVPDVGHGWSAKHTRCTRTIIHAASSRSFSRKVPPPFSSHLPPRSDIGVTCRELKGVLDPWRAL